MRTRVAAYVGTAAGLTRHLARSHCPACGQSTDACPGHSENSDSRGWVILNMHDEDWHVLCHSLGCPSAP
ncbi:MAG: hypothetical protein NVS3B1_06060 [Marmoricola sp.]